MPKSPRGRRSMSSLTITPLTSIAASKWMERHPCFVFHFTPTSASWLNAVEAQKRLKRGVFRSVQELKDAIHRFLNGINANPKPFTWTKDPYEIIASVKRAFGH